MGCDITNNSEMNTGELSQLIDDLASAIKEKVGFKSMPAITLQDDQDNADTLLGKTAYYDPQNKVITVYVTSRHPKDILRSIAHEFIHHGQNLRGEFENVGSMGEGYAQNDEHLRNMEKEAYLQGNMCFRDWEDQHKLTISESKFLKENKTMTTKITKEFLKEKIVETLNKMINEDVTLQFSDGEKSAVRNAPNKRAAQLTARKLLQRKGLQGSDASRAVGQIVRAFYDEKTMDPSTGLAKAKDGLDKSALAQKVKNNTILKFLDKDDQEGNFDAAAMDKKFKGAIATKDIPSAKPSDPGNKERISSIDKSFNMKGVNPDLDRARDEYERLLDKYQIAPVTREGAESELEEKKKPELKNPKKADLDKNGKLSSYERNRGKAIEKSMAEEGVHTPEGENSLYEQRFTPKNTKLYEKLLEEWTK